MARRSWRRNGNGIGVSAQRAPMNLRLVTTRYGPSTRPLNLNASGNHPRRENWDDWVAVDERQDVSTLVNALKTWYPSLEGASSDSEWEDVESPRSKRASLSPLSPSNSKGKARASEDDGGRRPSTSSLQSVLEDDEGETSGADADISAEGSSRLNSASTLAMASASSSTTSSLGGQSPQQISFSHSDSQRDRSPGASYTTPRSYPTMSFSTQRSPGASYATPRSSLPSFTTDRAGRPSFSSHLTENAEQPIPERPSFETQRSFSRSPYTPDRQLSFATDRSIELTPIARPLTFSPSINGSLAPSPYSDYAEHPGFSRQRSLRTAASFSTQRSAASVQNASMGLALRLPQVSAVPMLTALPSLSSSELPGPTTPSTLSRSASRATRPPRARIPPIPSRAHTPGTPCTPDTSSRCTPGTSAFASSFSFPVDTATATSSSLLPSLPSHMVLSPSRSLSSFATFGQRRSLASTTLLHDLDAESLAYSRSILSLPSVPSMAGFGPFLNDLDAVSLGGGAHEGAHERTYDSNAETLPTTPVSQHGGWTREVSGRGANGVCIPGPNATAAAAVTTQAPKSGRTPRTNAEEYAAPVVPRFPTRPLDSSGEAADGGWRMARTLRSIQSLGSLRPAASLQSLRAKFAKRPSVDAPRLRVKSKGKKRPTLPSHFNGAVPSTPSQYHGGVLGSPVPRRFALLPRGGAGASPLRCNGNGKSPKPKSDPRSKPPRPSARLRFRRSKSHLLRHEA